LYLFQDAGLLKIAYAYDILDRLNPIQKKAGIINIMPTL
jgi:hypothetical protein